MRRVAAIDVGTNSVRLLVAERAGDGSLRDVERDLIVTRLGERVDADRILGAEPLRRTVAAVAAYAERARTLHAGRVRIAATSAVRDASNGRVFFDAVRAATGIDAELLSGDEEARLSFAGAAQSFDPAERKVVVDIGGGSTELVAGRATVDAAISLDTGSVRLTERHVRDDPPAAAQIESVRADARAHLARGREALGPYADDGPRLVGVAGTITTVAAIALGVDGYDRDAIHRSVLDAATIERIRGDLAAMTSEQRRGLPAMPRGREDVIVAGAVLLEEVLRAFDVPRITVSETDILDGLATSIPA